MQQHNEKLKYLLDIQAIVSELENILTFLENDYSNFTSNFIAIRALKEN